MEDSNNVFVILREYIQFLFICFELYRVMVSRRVTFALIFRPYGRKIVCNHTLFSVHTDGK